MFIIVIVKIHAPTDNLRKSFFSKSFFTACKKSDILNFKFHDLRHTFASQLTMAGIGLRTVQELLGHKSIEMTLGYSHLSPDHKKRAVDILGQQMDTNWSQEPKSEVSTKEFFDITLDNKEDIICAPIAQVDRAVVS